MKSIIPTLTSVSALAAAGFLMTSSRGQAQAALQDILIQYRQTSTQTSTAAPVLAANPYSFSANIDGNSSMTATDPISSATVTPSDGPAQSLTIDTDNQQWKYESSGYADTTAFTAAFPTGGYTFGLTGSAPANGNWTVSMPADPFSADVNAPQLVSVTNATWVGGVLKVADVTQPVVFTFNHIWSGSPGATQGYNVDIELDGNSQHFNGPNGFYNYDPTGGTALTGPAVADWTLAANSLVSGQTYNLQLSYLTILGVNSTFSDNSGLAASLFEKATTITVSSVPEPTTAALWIGLIALAGVLAFRRKRAA